MRLQDASFGIMYRLGFTPWNGHPQAQSLRDLIEGDGASSGLRVGTALDVGCGTGDSSIYLARHGWQVTGVDFVSAALAKARAKAAAEGVRVDFVKADVAQLSSAGVGPRFDLIVDNGCLHSMSANDRDGYVREIAAVTDPDAQLLLVAFAPGGQIGVPGIAQAEVERRFTPNWVLLSSGQEPVTLKNSKHHARYYLWRRRK